MTFWDKWIFTSFGSAVAVALQNGLLFADLPLLPNKVPPLPEQRLHPKVANEREVREVQEGATCFCDKKLSNYC